MVPRAPSRPRTATLRLLLAALVLFTRLLAPAPGMATPAAPAPLWPLQAICHAADPEPAHGPDRPHHDHDCLLCPACHLAAQPALLATPVPSPVPPAPHAIGQATRLPPATAPPATHRRTAQPTGPPASSV